MEASAYTADGMLAKEIEDELMKYTKNYDHKVEANLAMKTNEVQTKNYDHKVEANLAMKTNEVQTNSDKVEANLAMKTNEVQTNSDVEVNITECTKSLGNELVAAELQDTTENSSSFDECNSGNEDVDTFGDSEASSDFHGDAASAHDFDRFGERFKMRRRKLTTQWRSFVQPLMWRCKWAELQIKKLQSQAQLYDRKIETYNAKKRTQLDNSTMVDGTKSLPFSSKNAKNDIFKRRKRRRTEATTDVAAYMSHHNLFSCFENRKCLTEGAFMNNEVKNLANQKITSDHELGNDELLSFELGDGDKSLGQILSKIDFLQSEVGKLQSRLDRITRENADRLSNAGNLVLSPPHSENRMEGVYISSQNTGAQVLPSGTSYVDAPITSGRINPACIEAAYKSVEDGVLIDNKKVKEEMDSFEEVKIQQMPLVPKDELGNTSPSVIADEKPPAKVRSIAKITGTRSERKRGRKKVATGRGRRRSAG